MQVIAPDRRGVVRVVGDGVLVLDRPGAGRDVRAAVRRRGDDAVLEVGERIEAIGAVRALDEGVVDVELLHLEARLDDVGVEIVGRRQFVLIERVVHEVVVAREVGTEDDIAVVGVVRDVVDAVRADPHFGELVAAQRGLVALHLDVAIAELGREPVGPVGEELEGVGVEILGVLVPVRREIEHARARGRRDRRRALRRDRQRSAAHPLIGQLGAVLVVDGPVQLGEPALVLFGVAAGETHRVEAPHRIGDRSDAVDVRLADARNLEGERVGGGAFAGPDGDRRHALDLVVAEEEEQRVLDDRAAEGRAVGLFLEHRSGRQLLALGAAQAVVLEVIIGRAVEIVLARLGDDVDHAATEIVVLGVIGRHRDLHLLRPVERQRRTRRGIAAAVEAEAVILGHAVDEEGVAARVRAGDRQGRVGVAEIDIGERALLDDFLDVASDGGKVLDALGVELGADAAIVDRRIGVAHADDGDGLFGRDLARGNRDVQTQRLAQRQIDVLDLGRLIAGRRHRHRVGAADRQAGGVEEAAVRRGRGVGLAGAFVLDGDRRAGHRETVGVDHRAADAGRNGLRHRGHGHRQSENGQRNAAE